MLFSVKLTAHAAYGMSNESIAKQAFKTIEETSQNAVNEMRALIWQLKPVGLEQGLIHALTAYSKLMHIQLIVNVEGLIDLSNEIEETYTEHYKSVLIMLRNMLIRIKWILH